MKLAQYIADFFVKSGVGTIFGHIGGFNADIVDAIYANEKLTYVLNYHEQAAAFAANSFAVIRESTGIAVASGAPSACNLIPGIANAFFDSVPCIFIAGSVHSKAIKKSAEIRQNAFEEIDMVSLVSNITKFAAKVEKPEDIKFYLEKAFYTAHEGRPGPVLLDIPYDVARSDVDVDMLKGFILPKEMPYDAIDAEWICNTLKKSKKPLLLLGGGARSSQSRSSLIALLEKVKIPAVASLCGLDVLPHDHECFCGFIGHYGNRYANFALANCDCLIVLGSRLDERQIAGDTERFAPGAKIIRVDVDRAELGRNLPEYLSLFSSVENFLEVLVHADFSGCNYNKWQQVISTWEKRYPSYNLDSTEVSANNFLHVISSYLPEDAVICADVGQNQMFTAQSLRLDKKRKLLNSAGYGSMGFSLPASVGAAYGAKEPLVLSINGDGGIQMNIQELQTLKRDNLPVKIIVLNNHCLGMIRRLQERIFDDRTVASVAGYSVPDYSAISVAYGLNYLRVDSVEKYRLVKDFLSDKTPCLIEVFLQQKIMNNPEPGAGVDLQTPLLSAVENDLIKKESSL